mgnify:FL=1|jgi:uncharacterized membrane protein|tara:strand:- start:3699 stop:3950 length:252 start_codon:yes stop_codon:yes gene_type:complete
MVRPRIKPIGDKMRDPVLVTKEAVVVGASLLVVGSVLMALPLPKAQREHPAWPYIGTFIAGFATHWIYEVIGANNWYCDNYEE